MKFAVAGTQILAPLLSLANMANQSCQQCLVDGIIRRGFMIGAQAKLLADQAELVV